MRLKYRGQLFHDQRGSAARNLIRAGAPEAVAMRITGHKPRYVFVSYNTTSERDLADAARRIEPSQISYSHAKLVEVDANTQAVQTKTAQ